MIQHSKLHLQIAYWLIACVIAVWLMVIIGGITRLSGSGLSIVKWQPIVGLIPPLTKVGWNQAFLDYQKFPEFQKVTFAMSLTDFKSIYLIEWGHRFVGRLIGLILLVPTVICLLKREARFLWKRLAVIWLLGLAQGAMGWYMVKSGLVHDPWVSPYRLTAHLFLALLILATLLWTILDLWQPKLQEVIKVSKSAWLVLLGLLGTLLLTLLFGGLTAGLKAGLVYNTFPDMGGYWLPPESFHLNPWWLNFFENPVLVQASHRMLAMITFGLTLVWCFQTRKIRLTRYGQRLNGALIVAVGVQVLFGVSTLLLGVPIVLGVMHQAWAVVVLLCVVAMMYGVRPMVGALAIQPPPSTRLPA